MSHQEKVPSIINEFEFQDKIMHFIAYFVYAITMQITIIGAKLKAPRILIIFFSLLFAISDEFHQYFIPGRSADIYDILADFTGILVSMLFYKKIEKLVKKYERTI